MTTRKQLQLKNHPDFQVDGKWVQKFSPEPCVTYSTRAGVLWTNFTQRCKEGGSLQKAVPAYKGSVNGFKDFQEFAEWCQGQIGYNNKDSRGHYWQLDKDILVKNNKVYSPDTCVFIPKSLNCLLERRANDRGEYPIGVVASGRGCFAARVSRGILGLKPDSTYHKNPIDAFYSYKRMKEKYIKEVADFYRDRVDPRVYEALYKYEVDIDD